ncbi:MAG: hypothetical protein MUP27_08945 [Desulfobacterales bacterium]|nr:hypothetical protein [Desulfobacterales bacterium]
MVEEKDKTEQPKEGQYKCATCGGIFDLQNDEEWNDKKAKEELRQSFSDVSLDDCDQICDDCYQKVCPDANPDLFERYKKECEGRN